MNNKKRALFVGAALAGALAFTAPSHAASYNGVCESSGGGEVCLYYGSSFNGGLYDTLYSKDSYTGTFYGTSTPINDNVSSVVNKDPDTPVKFFSGTGYTGYLETVGAGSSKSLTYKNAASSHCFTSNAACP